MLTVNRYAWIVALVAASIACSFGAPAAPTPVVVPSAIPTAIVVASTSVPITNTPACTPQTGWPTYRVQAGDSVSVLASRTGSTTDALVKANCLSSPNQISEGQVLYVPRIPNTPVPTVSDATIVHLDELGIMPSQGQSITDRMVQPGAQVALTVGVRNAASVSFMLKETGKDMINLGTSASPTNVAQLMWQVPNNPGLEVYLSAQAIGSDGVTSASTVPVKVTIARGVTGVPGIGKLTASQSEGPNDLDRTVKAGSHVTLAVDGVTSALHVKFFIQTKEGATNLLGLVDNPPGVAQYTWLIPDQPGLEVTIFAVASNEGTQVAQSQPVLFRVAA